LLARRGNHQGNIRTEHIWEKRSQKPTIPLGIEKEESYRMQKKKRKGLVGSPPKGGEKRKDANQQRKRKRRALPGLWERISYQEEKGNTWRRIVKRKKKEVPSGEKQAKPFIGRPRWGGRRVPIVAKTNDARERENRNGGGGGPWNLLSNLSNLKKVKSSTDSGEIT